MASYKAYQPEQALLLPLHAKDVLGENHLCFLVHELVEGLDISGFEASYGDAGGESPYHPRLMIKVWLYAFALKVKSTRKLEQRIREDLGFRFLAGGSEPDHKTLSEFLRLHGKAMVELFTQVLQLLRRAGVARLGEVAIDSTRGKGNASRERVVRRSQLEDRVRQWMQELDEDPDRQPGRAVSEGERQRVQEPAAAGGSCGRAAKASCRSPMARLVFCVNGRASCWATRARLR
jgi:transposase